MLGLPLDVRLLIFWQFKRDLLFRMYRETAVRLRPRDMAAYDPDIFYLRDGDPWTYDVDECLDAIQDVRMMEGSARYGPSVDYYYERIKYLTACPFATEQFHRQLVGRVFGFNQRRLTQ